MIMITIAIMKMKRKTIIKQKKKISFGFDLIFGKRKWQTQNVFKASTT